MMAAFSLDDLVGLCMDLDVDYEQLPGDTKRSKVDGLFAEMERRKESYKLVKRCAELRPARNWLLT